MAGLVTHRWNGTVLTIISDSGSSSMDLAGPKGDKGCRGPQGRCGVILDADGNIITEGYATEEYVDNQIAAIELLPGPMGPSGVDGEPGKDGGDGTGSFDELTDAQKASLKGDKGDKGETGDTYTITEADYQAIAEIVVAQFVSAEEVAY